MTRAILAGLLFVVAEVGMLSAGEATVSAGEMREFLARIAFERHRSKPEQVERARVEIVRALEAEQWTVVREPFTIAGVAGVNLRARRAGTKPDARTWIVGAHYDTVSGSPGADDNASGVAALVGIARVFRDAKFLDAVELVAFDLEESLHGGSEVLARKMRADRERVAAMISLEMLGCRDPRPGAQSAPAKLLVALPELKAELARRKGRGDFLAAITNAAGTPWVAGLVAAGATLGVPFVVIPATGPLTAEPALRRSDHAPFWDAGFPAMAITDTAEHRNPRYHTARDTADTLDYEFLAAGATAVARMLAEAAGVR